MVNINAIGGAAVLLVTAVFYSQRNFPGFGGYLPNALLVLLAATGLVLLVLGLTTRRGEGPAESVPRGGLLRALGLLIGWVAVLRLLGYQVAGLLFFMGAATALRTQRPRLRGIALDAAVSVLSVVGFYYVFTRLLSVSLPRGSLW